MQQVFATGLENALNKADKAKAQQRFQEWLLQMDHAISEFIASAPPAIRSKLDRSDESLDVLEAWVLSKFASLEQLRPIMNRGDVAHFLDGASRYLGEFFRQASGSNWVLELDDPKNAAYNRPSLLGGTLSVQSCPFYKVTASISRRTGNYFSTILPNVREDNLVKTERAKSATANVTKSDAKSGDAKFRRPLVSESDGSETYATLFLIDPSAKASADELAAALGKEFPAPKKDSPRIVRRGSEFKLSWPDFSLFISRNDSEHVLQESAEMAGMLPPGHPMRGRVTACKARYELSANKDENMDHFNFYVFVVEAIEKMGSIYTFDPYQAKFMNI
jgi:hypothetical protein